jgi:N-acetylneuraminic acid mutarotase
MGARLARWSRRLLATIGVALLTVLTADARELTFEDRVHAQVAIERVFYSHQIGATRPFEEAVPRELLERKVRTYLKQSLSLERVWNAPVTAEMLRQELERIARSTRMPDRLRELHAALGNDPFLIQECLVRPVLADRLARDFFARDPARHAAARRAAQRLREDLRSGRIDAFARSPLRTVWTLVRIEGRRPGIPPAGDDDQGQPARRDGLRFEVGPEEFARWSEGLAGPPGEIGAVLESDEAFTIRVALARTPDTMRIAVFAIEKGNWNDWWKQIEVSLDEQAVRAVAAADVSVPAVSGPSCGAFDTWSPIDVAPGSPTRRTFHAAVWTGSLMIVWGGALADDDVVFQTNTGGRYDPAMDVWTAVSTVNAPVARWLHTAVWTGDRMVIWGGYNNVQGTTNTGGRYNPTDDSWTATSTTGAPAGKEAHTAIWTGSRMIVWGGDLAEDSRTGGRYDPATDTWSPTSLLNAPSSRIFHTAVWTGDLMVVWGGQRSSALATGGRYDPATDTWTATSLTGAPTARSGHTAVWTGDRMVVWGGSITSTGALYDPVTDSWTPTSTINAPGGRGRHTALWMGDEMLVWGGGLGSPSSGLTVFDTGGRYDPVTDAWVPTSTVNAPSARQRHVAVPAGDLMLVWGGEGPGGIDLGDGGACCACATGTYFQDSDGDGHGDPGVSVEACSQPAGFVLDSSDCNDADAAAWGTPSEVPDLGWMGPATLAWTPPSSPGGAAVLYDLLRSTDPSDFGAGATCVESDHPFMSATESTEPLVGGVFFYLVRPETACPGIGQGPLGTASDGTPRTGRTCP